MPTLAHTPALATQIRIVADDLTGACDSAVPFLATGHSVRVWLSPTATHNTAESVQAFNTASRALSPDEAAAVTTRATAALNPSPGILVFKKVDSAGRGPIAAEVLAANRTLGTDAVLFAPSFPAAGRLVRNGILCVRNAADGNSHIPLLPLFEPHAKAVTISHPSQIPQALGDGAIVLVCDASTQSDLDALAAFDQPNLLYAGSAGLARALAAIHQGTVHASPQRLPRGSALTICGTRHPVTQLQLQHLACLVPAAPILHLRAEPNQSIIRSEFARHAPDIMIVTGGDTALLVLATLGATSIILGGELAPGIPWGIVDGGVADNRIVITKSGGFGAPDTLTRILRGLA
jgi:uncharacterized protein YgbK (DUF1537 family)